MSKNKIIFPLIVTILIAGNSYATDTSYVAPNHVVSLKEAHIGTEGIDMKLLESYLLPADNVRSFYAEARSYLAEKPSARFTDVAIIRAAEKNRISVMGGPMLGDLKENSVTLWMRPAANDPLEIRVKGPEEKTYRIEQVKAGTELRVLLNGLKSGTSYPYEVMANGRVIAGGQFTTAPEAGDNSIFRVTFGSCFHKIGLHNPNLIDQILKCQPQAMMLLGDIASDGRRNMPNLHRSDYLLRDMSAPWKQLAANVPIYAVWDDHDYHSNDRGGIFENYTEADRQAVREVWFENWNNPDNDAEGINFHTRIGPVELIMLDTRSCREVQRRGQYGAYLGEDQQKWLMETLKASTAPFKIISSGTMWSDYITPGKDSWGTWDTTGREEVFSFIEEEEIEGVLLISGDRHGARGFTIPRPAGHQFYEFEAASLGGVPGPPAMAEDTTWQLFGYHGSALFAFGEFTFDMTKDEPMVTFRLIDQHGVILEEHELKYHQLTPRR